MMPRIIVFVRLLKLDVLLCTIVASGLSAFDLMLHLTEKSAQPAFTALILKLIEKSAHLLDILDVKRVKLWLNFAISLDTELLIDSTVKS